MKKLTTLLALLLIALAGVAQVTTPSTAGDWLTVDQFKALAGTGERFAMTPVGTAETNGVTTWFRFTSDLSSTLDETALFTLEDAGSGFYNFKRESDGQYANTGGNFSSTPLNIYLVARTAGDHADGLVSPYSISFDESDGGNHFNSNSLQFAAGTGGWSAYAIYGPFYKNVTINYVNDATEETVQPSVTGIVHGGEIAAPEISGYTVVGTSTASINADNQAVTFRYQQVSTNSVTYVVKVDGATIFTSDPVEINTGTVITTLPAEYQNTMFYSYPTINETVNEDKEIVFNATLKDSAPFTPSTESKIVWHYLNLSTASNYLTYSPGSAQNVTIPTENAGGSTTQWAFIGYKEFKIVNKAAGTSLVLGSAATTGAASEGGDVYATLATPGSQANESWTVVSSTNRTNGFYIFNTEGHALNKRNGTSNVSYWTGGYDAGSTFVAEKAPTLAELCEAAYDLYEVLNTGATTIQVGYPKADALSTFNQAISTAEAEIDGSGEDAAYTALLAAIEAVQNSANINYIPRTDVYYTITNSDWGGDPSRGSMIYNPDVTVFDSTNDNAAYIWSTAKEPVKTLDSNDPNHLWGFIERDGKYYMYNVGKKQFATIGSGSYGATWIFSDTPSIITMNDGDAHTYTAPNVRFQATIPSTGATYNMSMSTSYDGPFITYYHDYDGGVPMLFDVSNLPIDDDVTAAIEALIDDLTPYIDALNNAIAGTTNLSIGTDLNQYAASEAYTTALAAAQAEANNTAATKVSLTTARENLESAINGLQLNQPEAGRFLRIKTAPRWAGTNATAFSSTQPYLSGTNNATNGRAVFSTAADKSTIWYLTEMSGTKYLVNYSTGYPAIKNASNFLCVGEDTQFLTTNGTSIIFSDAANGELHAYNIVFGTNRYLYTNAGLYSDAGGNPAADGYNFQLEYVDELPVTLNNGGDGNYYATFSSPADISSVSGAATYKIVKTTDTKAKYDELGVTGIPANTGVLLIGTEDTATMTIGEYTGEAVETGLTAIIAAQGTLTNGYVLGMYNDKVGFYTHSGASTGGFKAYLPAGSGDSKGLALEAADETDGISLTETDNAEATAVYNLHGQRVEKAQRGIYIQNGRKVVVK